MSFLREVKEIIREHRIKVKKRLGQNFLVDSSLIKRMVSRAEICPDEVILDIGAGFGFLTEEIAKIAKKVIAIEMDPKIVEVLKLRLKDVRNVEIVHGDFLRMSLPKFDKVVSTPPYSISSPLMFKLLEYDFDRAVLAFQNEFAKRLVALPGTDDYSRLTVMAYYKARIDLLETVPRGAFHPPPDVDSALIQIMPREPPFQVVNEKFFSDMVLWLFTQRKRVLRKGLSVFLEKIGSKTDVKELVKSLPFAEKRIFQLTPEELGSLCNMIYGKVR